MNDQTISTLAVPPNCFKSIFCTFLRLDAYFIPQLFAHVDLVATENDTILFLRRAWALVNLKYTDCLVTDLKALDAIGVLVSFLEKGAPLDGQAAYAIGTAASNNPKFQTDIAMSNPEVFDQLVKVLETGWSDNLLLLLVMLVNMHIF